MSLQEKLQERKEKKEAQSYFRENNSEYLDMIDYVKAFIVGALTAVVGGFMIQFIGNVTGFNFIYIFLFVGYGVGAVIKKVVNTGNMKLAWVALLAYVVGVSLGMVMYFGFEIGFSNVSNTMFMLYFKSIFRHIPSVLCIAIGGVCAFMNAKD